uniref:Uncharacterized protein n=1 Tax=Theileria parva TaxID=5875 RepID=Q4N601_THEPA|eukprot:XP_764705.1 hypothetical protein [Theileria parva strain Muguga]
MRCILTNGSLVNIIFPNLVDKKFINFGIFKLNNYSIRSETSNSKGFETKNLNLSKKDSDTNTTKITVLLHKPYGYMSTYSRNVTNNI